MQPIQRLQGVGHLRISWLTQKAGSARTWLATIESRPALAARVLLGAWLVTRAALFVGMLVGHSYADPAFYNYAGKLAAGQWPYRDVPVEYPPLAMVLILLPALPLLPFSGIAPRLDPAFVQHPTTLPHPDPLRYGAYGESFALFMLAFDALTLWLVVRAARKLVPGDSLGMRTGLFYVGLVFLSGALLQKFDLVTGALCLAAVLALVEGHDTLAGTTLALATLVKGFPVLALPIFVGYVVARSRKGLTVEGLRDQAQSVKRLAVSFGAVVAASLLLVTLWAGFGAVWHTLTYHTGRGTEIESLYGDLLLLMSWLPGLHATTAFNGEDLSRVVLSPLNGAMDVLALAALACGIVLAYSATWRVLRRTQHQTAAEPWHRIVALTATLAVLLAFEVTFLALPAHYLLVAAPLAVLARLPDQRAGRWLIVGLLGVALFGQVVIAIWPSLVGLQPWAVLLLTLRNCCWVIALAVLIFSLWTWPAQAVQGFKTLHR